MRVPFRLKKSWLLFAWAFISIAIAVNTAAVKIENVIHSSEERKVIPLPVNELPKAEGATYPLTDLKIRFGETDVRVVGVKHTIAAFNETGRHILDAIDGSDVVFMERRTDQSSVGAGIAERHDFFNWLAWEASRRGKRVYFIDNRGEVDNALEDIAMGLVIVLPFIALLLLLLSGKPKQVCGANFSPDGEPCPHVHPALRRRYYKPEWPIVVIMLIIAMLCSAWTFPSASLALLDRAGISYSPWVISVTDFSKTVDGFTLRIPVRVEHMVKMEPEKQSVIIVGDAHARGLMFFENHKVLAAVKRFLVEVVHGDNEPIVEAKVVPTLDGTPVIRLDRVDLRRVNATDH